MRIKLNNWALFACLGFLASSTIVFQPSAHAQNEIYTTTITDVSAEYLATEGAPKPSYHFVPPGIIPTPTPYGNKPTEPEPTPIDPYPYPYPGTIDPGAGGTVGTIISIGARIWDFIVNNRPNMEYQTIESAVVPAGISSWTQLTGWTAKGTPTIKVYRVEFKNIRGKPAGGFDYRISFIHGGGIKGVGKYIGKLSFVPTNTKLKIDRSLKVRAQMLDPFNVGTEDDPIAATSIRVSWESPTTTRYSQNSAEYMIMGSGEINDISNGNL